MRRGEHEQNTTERQQERERVDYDDARLDGGEGEERRRSRMMMLISQ